MKSILHEKEALEFRFTSAQAIIQLYLTSAALKESLGSLPLHVVFSDTQVCVQVYGLFTPDSGDTVF